MNDDFLYEARPEVPPGLALKIEARLRQLEQHNRSDEPASKVGRPLSKTRTMLIIALALAGLAACVVGVKRIGGLAFREVEDSPQVDSDAYPAVPQRIVPLDLALSGVSFEVGLPTWLPEGYRSSEDATISLPTENASTAEAWQVFISWQKGEASANQIILLSAYSLDYEGGYPLPVGPQSLEEIDINGNPGGVITGNWIGARWEPTMGGTVRWIHGDTAYWLNSAWVSVEDLIRIARSIP
jgi:hypothetical protein